MFIVVAFLCGATKKVTDKSSNKSDNNSSHGSPSKTCFYVKPRLWQKSCFLSRIHIFGTTKFIEYEYSEAR